LKKYILFDNDGVLVETEKWYYEANAKALKEINITLELEEYLEIMARGGTAWEVALKKGISKQLIEKQRAKRDIHYKKFLKTENIDIPDVNDVLNELSKEYKMAIITTSTREHFDLIHKPRAITDFMEFTLCVEEYKRAKPFPDPYLDGLKRFNGEKKEAIIIEDSQRGLTSAYNAGIECVIVSNEFTKSHDFSKADYFIDTLKELKKLLSTL
jgi:HAD superfamily hydrolase (TIGR01509 family)